MKISTNENIITGLLSCLFYVQTGLEMRWYSDGNFNRSKHHRAHLINQYAKCTLPLFSDFFTMSLSDTVRRIPSENSVGISFISFSRSLFSSGL